MAHRNRSAGKRSSTPESPARGNEQRTRFSPRGGSSISVLSSLFSGKNGLSRLLGMDGYSNAAAFLGDDSPLLSAGTFRRSNLTSRTELLTTAYRESWLAKKIIDMPSEDITRAWYTLSTRLPEENLRELRRLEARHSVRQEITNAIRWARLYGGSLAVMIIRGEEERLDMPLDPGLLAPECFQGLLVLDRAQGIEPSLELVDNLDDPDYGLPRYYTVSLNAETVPSVRIHHSRVLRFIGRELPRLEAIAENNWGASELEHIWEELQKRSATSANIAQLVFQANVTTLKMADFGEALAMGTDDNQQRILNALSAENRLRSSYGLQILSANDSMENHAYSFTGLSEIYETFMMDMAGAAEIPAITQAYGTEITAPADPRLTGFGRFSNRRQGTEGKEQTCTGNFAENSCTHRRIAI